MANSFWDDFKDLFKTEDQKKAEKQRKLEDAERGRDELEKKLQQLEDEYNVAHKQSAPSREEIEKLFSDDFEGEEKEYDQQSREEMERQAREEQRDEKASAVKKTEDKYDAKLDAARADSDKLAQARQDSLSKLKNTYEAERDDLKDTAIRNGVSSGSILAGEMKKLGENGAKDARAAYLEYAEKQKEIDDEITRLKEEKDAALDKVDVKYAQKLQKRIDELAKESEKQRAEVEKYNNELREKRAEYESERQQSIDDYYAEEMKKRRAEEDRKNAVGSSTGYAGDKRENYQKRYEMAYDFYTSLSDDVALEALLASPNMKYYLGTYYYNMLRDELKERQGPQGPVYYY